jgi:hypothetical protein
MTRSNAHYSYLKSWAETLAGEASLTLCFTPARRAVGMTPQRLLKQSHCPCLEAPSNFGVKLTRPVVGPAAELPSSSPA